MEPQIQYATTSDGVRIAYCVRGDGPGVPLIMMQTLPFTHVQSWRWERLAPQLAEPAALAQGRRVAWSDFRGCGLSDRAIADMSMGALSLDLEAVVQRLEWPRFFLCGAGMSGPIAISYTANNPGRVAALVLRETYARASEIGRIPRMRALGALLRVDWDTYLENQILMTFGWQAAELGPKLVAMLRECVTYDVVRELAAATPTYDVSKLVESIGVRTLVIGRDDTPVPSPDMLRQLGSRIRNARVVMVRGGAAAYHESQRAISEFLAEGDAVDPILQPELPSGTAVIVFADIVDSTALTERMGDAAFRAKARELDTALRGIIREAGGTPAEGKLLGDGVHAYHGRETECCHPQLAPGGSRT
ncbi:MAG: hypothetical protein A2W34_05245 [Chloroflexi bacterium RBG_16_64_32]|nr:MAG: hypothetical protein A2W34_05245 [Chloroflexi bacterium RBG_16_64_32]